VSQARSRASRSGGARVRVRREVISLENLVDECDEHVAYIRSVDAEGSLEHLRGDVEALASAMRRAAEVDLPGGR
jgi:hypothetical protein